ncbi:MAG: hypothetical protein AAGF31_08905 [Planctomycetota bacterium]
MLSSSNGEVVRSDYSQDAWRPPAADADTAPVAWWRSRMPTDDASKPKLAPNDVLLSLFDQWADEPARRDSRYVLALLLIRRRVFRIAEAGMSLGDGSAEGESTTASDSLDDLLRVECPSRDETYELQVTPPGPDRAAIIQAELNELLYADTSQ